MKAVLQVQDLRVRYRTRTGPLDAVDGVSFSLAPGEGLGVVGESGCGKTTLARALLRLLPPQGEIVAGRLEIDGVDMLPLAESAMRRIRWRRIAMVPQSAMHALNPVHRIGDQIAEVLQVHEHLPRSQSRRRAGELLHTVGIDEGRYANYPHQLSGGQRQRVVIAMALALSPAVLIADEPTTALDMITQHDIVQELLRLRRTLGVAILHISHDVSLIAQTCDRIAIMYAGRFVEVGTVAEVLEAPTHPYMMGLRNALPDLRHSTRLVSMPGAPPLLTDVPPGCPFHLRCPFAVDICRTTPPPLEPIRPGHLVACHRAAEAPVLRPLARDEATWDRVAAGP